MSCCDAGVGFKIFLYLLLTITEARAPPLLKYCVSVFLFEYVIMCCNLFIRNNAKDVFFSRLTDSKRFSVKKKDVKLLLLGTRLYIHVFYNRYVSNFPFCAKNITGEDGDTSDHVYVDKAETFTTLFIVYGIDYRETLYSRIM